MHMAYYIWMQPLYSTRLRAISSVTIIQSCRSPHWRKSLKHKC